MRFKKLHLKNKKISQLVAKEDLQYLQKKISGRSVYRKLSSMYMRTPKHKKVGYAYRD